jgi:hypothetical protein
MLEGSNSLFFDRDGDHSNVSGIQTPRVRPWLVLRSRGLYMAQLFLRQVSRPHERPGSFVPSTTLPPADFRFVACHVTRCAFSAPLAYLLSALTG